MKRKLFFSNEKGIQSAVFLINFLENKKKKKLVTTLTDAIVWQESFFGLPRYVLALVRRKPPHHHIWWLQFTPISTNIVKTVPCCIQVS